MPLYVFLDVFILRHGCVHVTTDNVAARFVFLAAKLLFCPATGPDTELLLDTGSEWLLSRLSAQSGRKHTCTGPHFAV